MCTLTSLIPVICGGVIALAGAYLNNYLVDKRKTASEYRLRRQEKLEGVFVAIFELDRWLKLMRNHHVSGSPEPNQTSPIAMTDALVSLYFPELDAAMRDFDTTVDKYELWTLEAGLERTKNMKVSDERLATHESVSNPYLKAKLTLLESARTLAKSL